jgi:hypothetical protein
MLIALALHLVTWRHRRQTLVVMLTRFLLTLGMLFLLICHSLETDTVKGSTRQTSSLHSEPSIRLVHNLAGDNSAFLLLEIPGDAQRDLTHQ